MCTIVSHPPDTLEDRQTDDTNCNDNVNTVKLGILGEIPYLCQFQCLLRRLLPTLLDCPCGLLNPCSFARSVPACIVFACLDDPISLSLSLPSFLTRQARNRSLVLKSRDSESGDIEAIAALLSLSPDVRASLGTIHFIALTFF